MALTKRKQGAEMHKKAEGLPKSAKHALKRSLIKYGPILVLEAIEAQAFANRKNHLETEFTAEQWRSIGQKIDNCVKSIKTIEKFNVR